MEISKLLFFILLSLQEPEGQCDKLNLPVVIVKNSVLSLLNNPLNVKILSRDIIITNHGQRFTGDVKCGFEIAGSFDFQNKSGKIITHKFSSYFIYSYKFNEWKVNFTDMRYNKSILSRIIDYVFTFIIGGFVIFFLIRFKTWLSGIESLKK